MSTLNIPAKHQTVMHLIRCYIFFIVQLQFIFDKEQYNYTARYQLT